MTLLEEYLRELGDALHVGSRERTRIVAEVRDHLEDSAAELQQQGHAGNDAMPEALRRFGPPGAIATDCNAAAGTRAMRRAPVVAFVAGLGVAGGLLIAGNTPPRPRLAPPAIWPMQVAFFLAVIAFQVAVVAGFCGASRALATWHRPVVRANDREFVRRAALLSTGALGAAALCWSVTLGIAIARAHHVAILGTAFGTVVMMGSGAVAILTTTRLSVRSADETPEDPGPQPSLLTLGEHVIAFVRDHPVITCSVVTSLATWTAMTHAETSVAGALPWGIAQATAVIVGFQVLGPRLELRRVF